MGYSGNMYAQATEVITSQGDLRRGDSSGNPERLAIGSSGKVLQSNGTTESWETLSLADTVLTTAGDVLFENATPELARLPKGSLNDVLTMGASLPAWSAPSAGAWSSLGSATEVSAASEISLDVADHDLYMVYYNVSTDASSTSMYMSATINEVTASTYRSTYSYSSGGAWSSGYNSGVTMFRIGGADLNDRAEVNCFGYIYMNKVLATSLSDSVTIRSITGNSYGTGGGTTNYMETSSGVAQSESDIESIQLKIENGLIQGSFTVNAMDF
jgi:hypothetical protein